jgi:hypothetical protein
MCQTLTLRFATLSSLATERPRRHAGKRALAAVLPTQGGLLDFQHSRSHSVERTLLLPPPPRVPPPPAGLGASVQWLVVGLADQLLYQAR